MQYLCLVYHDQRVFDRMTEEEIKTMQRDSAAYDTVLREAGKLVMAHPLKLPFTAKRVRVRARKRHLMDGPFAETKEQLIGFLLVNAASMDEAIDIAADVPLAKTGTIEVRGISFIGDQELEHTRQASSQSKAAC